MADRLQFNKLIILFGIVTSPLIRSITHGIHTWIKNEISEIYKLLGAKSLDEKRKVSNLIYDILNKDSHKDVSDNYKLDRYDVKKNHYNVLNDRDKRIAKKYCLNLVFHKIKQRKY